MDEGCLNFGLALIYRRKESRLSSSWKKNTFCSTSLFLQVAIMCNVVNTPYQIIKRPADNSIETQPSSSDFGREFEGGGAFAYLRIRRLPLSLN